MTLELVAAFIGGAFFGRALTQIAHRRITEDNEGDVPPRLRD